jgi:hypothetical protein
MNRVPDTTLPAKTGDWKGATSGGSGVPMLESDPGGIPANHGSDVPGTLTVIPCAGIVMNIKKATLAKHKDALANMVNFILIITLLFKNPKNYHINL